MSAACSGWPFVPRMPVTEPKGTMARPTRGCPRSLIGGWHDPRIRWREAPYLYLSAGGKLLSRPAAMEDAGICSP